MGNVMLYIYTFIQFIGVCQKSHRNGCVKFEISGINHWAQKTIMSGNGRSAYNITK